MPEVTQNSHTNLDAKKNELYIGLMSGTSIDGIDGVLAEITPQGQMNILATESLPWSDKMKAILNDLCTEGSSGDRIRTAGLAANAVTTAEATVCVLLLEKAKVSYSDVRAIGSHGQTVRHYPQLGFSVQLDNGPLLANLTDIDAITNFRAADLANDGEGAPLTQAFHQCVLSDATTTRFVLNLGGIANVTALGPRGKLITAFDTGPANTLLDYVCRTYLGCDYDPDGAYAASGTLDEEALSKLMDHPYLERAYPKSTGREDFNAQTIEFMLQGLEPLPQTSNEEPTAPPQADEDAFKDPQMRKAYIISQTAMYKDASTAKVQSDFHDENSLQRIKDILRTLTEFTVQSSLDCIYQIMNDHPNEISEKRELIVCGGGALNTFMLQRMQEYADYMGMQIEVKACTQLGVDPKYLEAQAFAFFAFCCSHAISLNLCSSTHATRPSILGTISPAPLGFYARAMSKLDNA